MKRFFHSRDATSKGAALIIVLALVVLATSLGLAYLTRTTTDRQLAQSSYNDTSGDQLARSALDITVSDFKQEIINNPTVTAGNIQPSPYPIPTPSDIPNLIRYSSRNAATSRASIVSSSSSSANGRSISTTRWNSHYLIPRGTTDTTINSSPIPSFTPPDWVLVTAQGPKTTPAPNAVIGRYAFAVYNEGGLINMNLGGFPTYANLSLPTRPARPGRRLPAKYPAEESEIMLAAFTPDDPNPCHGQGQPPNFTPDVTNVTIAAGVSVSLQFGTNHNPTNFGISNPPLPGGLSIDPDNGNIYGTPTDTGQWTVYQWCSNACGTGTAILHLTITGFPFAETTPWPVNLARKGTIGFADLTALPSIPTVITPTTQLVDMSGFPSPPPINQIMGWRNYATTQQSGASFINPSFPPIQATEDLYANYFLGAIPPFTTPFTTVRSDILPVSGRTDQAVMTRQELIRLQRTLCTDPVTGSYDDTKFPQSLLQYLGTFSREYNRPGGSWQGLRGSLAGARWDMNNLALVIPATWFYPGNHGQGHAYGKQRACCTPNCPPNNCDLATLFNIEWVYASNDFQDPTIRFTDPNYYGHWRYKTEVHTLNRAPFPPDNPDFFQVIDYAMNQAMGVTNPNHVRNTFAIGAALIDQYDSDDLHDSPSGGLPSGNTITVIDYLNDGNPFNYAYGVETMSFDDPNHNLDRAPFAPGPDSPPLPASYVRLNRRFESVGEFGYAYNPAYTPPRTLDFASAASNDSALLDFFSYNMAGNRAGTVNLNTRNVPVLASIIRGALLHDPGSENIPTQLVSPRSASPPYPRPDDALTAAQAIVQETTSNPATTRADVARLAARAATRLPSVLGVSDETRQTIARALAELGQARTWNVMIDVIAQTGKYTPDATDINQADKFIVQGEKRYWLHIALDRDDGTVLGSQLEEVVE